MLPSETKQSRGGGRGESVSKGGITYLENEKERKRNMLTCVILMLGSGS
jgi:hypothetical protein